MVFAHWLVMLMLFSGSPLNLPLSLPPLPADPLISNVAPEQCVWYMSLAGVDQANPGSKNKVEQLLAEEDVQQFTKQLITKFNAAIAKDLAVDPARKTLGEEGPKLAETLLTKPMCVYIGSIVPGAHGPMVRGGMVVNLGDEAAATEAALKKILEAIVPIGPGAVQPATGVETADSWHTLAMPAEMPPVQWGIKNKYLVIGIGDGEAAAIWGRSQKPAPQWLTNLQAKLKVERPSMVQYVNLQVVEGMAQMALAVVQGPEASKDTLDMLGLTNAKYFASVSGLEKDDFTNRMLIATDGPPIGLLSLLTGKPLDIESISGIPADATFAVAARVEPVKVVDSMLDILVLIAPREQLVGPQPNELKTKDIVNRQLDGIAGKLGVHPKNDVAAALGDTWCVYNSPSDGGLVVTGLTVTGTLKDRPKLIQVNDKLIAVIRQSEAQMVGQMGPGFVSPDPTIADCEYRGQKIYFLNFPQQAGSPVALSWCITEKHLVFGLYPQTIKAYLDRQAAVSSDKPSIPAGSKHASLASLPEVAAQFSGGSAPTVLVYQDTPSLFKLMYPLLQVGAEYGFSAMQANGIDLNISILPSASSLLPHLTPGVTSVTSSNDGIQIESHGTLPIGSLELTSLVLFGRMNVGRVPVPVPAPAN